MILRSRIDEEQTWNGTITKIDTQGEESNNNEMMYYEPSDSVEKATKYPFYVSLDSTDGLMMGQHLFIELDEGQMEAKEGIWLFEGYIVKEDEKSYVWAANANNKLEKREVELGEYDESDAPLYNQGGEEDEDMPAGDMIDGGGMSEEDFMGEDGEMMDESMMDGSDDMSDGSLGEDSSGEDGTLGEESLNNMLDDGEPMDMLDDAAVPVG